MIYDPLDVELNALIDKLNAIQKTVQTNDTMSALERGGFFDKFAEATSKIRNRISAARTLASSIKKLEGHTSKRSRELITLQAQLRAEIRKCEEFWEELSTIHRSETKKRRSKLSSRELQDRQEMVLLFQVEIEDLKINQKLGYIQGKYMDNNFSSKVGTMAQSDMFQTKEQQDASHWANSGNAVKKEDITEDQMQSLVEIRQRDHDIDKEIGIIGEGVDYLKHLATAMNDEVTTQNKALDRMQDKVEKVNERVMNVNERMKETLEAARSGEKLIVDIVCTVVLIGMCILLYSVSKAQE